MDSKLHLYKYKYNILNILLAAGGMFENSDYAADILYNASWQNRSDTVELLIYAGVDPDDSIDDNIPIIGACDYGATDVVKILIEAGCDVNASDYKDRTALMTATYYQYTDIVHLLIEAGADLVATNIHRDTALDIARMKKQYRIAGILERAMLKQGHVVSIPRQHDDYDEYYYASDALEQKHIDSILRQNTKE